MHPNEWGKIGTGEAFAPESPGNIKNLDANASPLRMDGSESGRMDGRPNGTQPGSIAEDHSASAAPPVADRKADTP